MQGKEKNHKKYDRNYPSMLYRFFIGYEGTGAPSFEKFARSIGVTTEDIQLYRAHKRFEKAYRECSEIRRDYLIDNALARRFDPTFVKYLLSEETEKCEDRDITITVEVVE